MCLGAWVRAEYVLKQQGAEIGDGGFAVIIEDARMFGKLADNKAIAFQRVPEKMGKTAGRIGIGAGLTTLTAFVSKKEIVIELPLDGCVKAVSRFLEGESSRQCKHVKSEI